MGIQRHSFNSQAKNSNAMIHLPVKIHHFLDGESVEVEKISAAADAWWSLEQILIGCLS